MHIFCKLLYNVPKRILPQTPVAVLTPQYLRQVGLAQAITLGTGCSNTCGYGTIRPINPGKVRFGFIPEEWFEFFYPKTGITGPYVFGLGLFNYLFSKEIYVCEHNFYSGLSLAILCIVVVKKLGPQTAKYADRQIDMFERNWKKQQEEEFKALQQMIDSEKLEQWRAEGNIMLMQVKKEIIALQVEGAYREALMKVYKDVKRCLDYQVECRHIEERLRQKHMVTWLVKNVIQQLPKNLDAEELEKLKQNITAMALQIK